MNRKSIAILIATISLTVMAAQSQDVSQEDKKEKVKTGWNVGGLPAITFDSDLGIQYGALLNIFNYGDGSLYPNFKHNLYIEWSRFTKGSGINRLFFDSKYLIPNVRFTADLSLLTDKMYDFYGFNGYETVFNSGWLDSKSDDYLSRAFYKYDRKMFRLSIDLQGDLAWDNFGWAAGLGLFNYKIGAVDIDALNKGKESDLLPQIPSLYEHFVNWGILSPEEAEGSFVSYLKFGMVYDTRDNEPNPNRGVWTEAVFSYAPSFLGIGKNYEHLKFNFTHRQYFTLISERLTAAYRIAYQGTVVGDCPFYLQPAITTLVLRGATSEGLGGGKSVRGIVRNRVVGDGIAWGNVELRWKFVRFQFINQNFYLSLNTFIDAGQVVTPVKYNTENIDWSAYDWQTGGRTLAKEDIFSSDKEEPHFSYGAGLRIVMNRNFIIAVDHGRPFDKRDGSSGTYIGLNFLF